MPLAFPQASGGRAAGPPQARAVLPVPGLPRRTPASLRQCALNWGCIMITNDGSLQVVKLAASLNAAAAEVLSERAECPSPVQFQLAPPLREPVVCRFG